MTSLKTIFAVVFFLGTLGLAPSAHAVELELVPQLGHAGKICVLAVNADETLIATGGDDKRVILYDAQSGLQLRSFDSHSNQITNLRFMEKSPILVVEDYSHNTYLWNFENGKLVKTLGQQTQLSPSGNLGVRFLEKSNELEIEETLTGVVRKIAVPNLKTNYLENEKVNVVTTLAIVSDQEFLTENKQQVYELRSLANGQVIRTLLRPLSDNPVEMRLSPDRRYALFFSQVALAEAPPPGQATAPPKRYSAWARMVELASGKVVHAFPEVQREEYIGDVLLHHDNNFLLTADSKYNNNPQYKIWNLARNRVLPLNLRLNDGQRASVWEKFLPEAGKLQLIFREYDRVLSREFLVDLESGNFEERIHADESANMINNYFQPNIHSVWEQGQFKVRDRAGKKFLTQLRARSSPVEEILFINDGKHMQVSSHPHKQHFWNLAEGKNETIVEFLAAKKNLANLTEYWWYFTNAGLMTPRGLIPYPISGFDYKPAPNETAIEFGGGPKLQGISTDRTRVLCSFSQDSANDSKPGEDRIYELTIDHDKLTAHASRQIVPDEGLCFFRDNTACVLIVKPDLAQNRSQVQVKELFGNRVLFTYTIPGLEARPSISKQGRLLISDRPLTTAAGETHNRLRAFDATTGKELLNLDTKEFPVSSYDLRGSETGDLFVFIPTRNDQDPTGDVALQYVLRQGFAVDSGANVGQFGAITNWYCYHERSCSVKTINPVVDKRNRVLSFKDTKTAVVSTVAKQDAVEIPVNTDGITDIALHDNQFAIAKADGTIDLYGIKEKKLLCTLIIARSGRDWLVYTPEGLFDSSPNGTDLLAYRISGTIETVPLDRFQQKYWTPGLLEMLSRGERPLPALNITRSLPPKVRFADNLKSGMNLSSNKLTVQVTAQTRNGYPIKNFQVLVDGRPYRGQLGTQRVTEPSLNEQTAKFELEFDSPGEHAIKVLAETDYVHGSSGELRVVYLGGGVAVKELPSMYVLTIGVAKHQIQSRSLDFANRDATELAAAFKRHSSPLYRTIETRVLVDDQATRRSIFEGLKWLREKMTGNSQAMGIVFFAGHGVVDKQDGTLYFLPHDSEDDDLAGTAIEADVLKKQLASIPGRMMLILDACHSGQLVSGGKERGGDVSDQLLRDLTSERNGMMVICSAGGKEKAQESRAFQHGVFTQAFLEALSGKGNGEVGEKSNKPRLVDGGLYLGQLNAYVDDRVRELTKGEQSPLYGAPPELKNIPISKP